MSWQKFGNRKENGRNILDFSLFQSSDNKSQVPFLNWTDCAVQPAGSQCLEQELNPGHGRERAGPNHEASGNSPQVPFS